MYFPMIIIPWPSVMGHNLNGEKWAEKANL